MSSLRYIAIEGLNGVGKSTLLKSLYQSAGLNVLKLHDPLPDDPFAKLRPCLTADCAAEFAMCYALTSYRAQQEALRRSEASTHVIFDRSPLSTFAYYAELGFSTLASIHALVAMPELVIWLDADDDEVERRLRMRASSDRGASISEELNENRRLRETYPLVFEWFYGTLKVLRVDGTSKLVGKIAREVEKGIEEAKQYVVDDKRS